MTNSNEKKENMARWFYELYSTFLMKNAVKFLIPDFSFLFFFLISFTNSLFFLIKAFKIESQRLDCEKNWGSTREKSDRKR